MKIRIRYGFYTDGDYSLRNSEYFGCTAKEIEIEDEFFDYAGVMDFENEEVCRCKFDAKTFLEKLLCDGIHISYTHYYLIEDFYNIIKALINFINENDIGELCKRMTGNYDGTYVRVEFLQ